jgi:ASC-1-like (ASCH) protein
MEMKRYILRFRQIDRNIFEAIKNGEKTVETRAATVKYRNIAAGDIMSFVCGDECIEKNIESAEIFKDIDSLLQKHRLKDIGPYITNREHLIKMYYSFPGYKEKIAKFGLIALKLSK